MVNVGASFQVVDVADIVFIETEKRSCKIHMKKERTDTSLQNESLNNYETHLKKHSSPNPQELPDQSGLCAEGDRQVSYNNGYCVKMKVLSMLRHCRSDGLR